MTGTVTGEVAVRPGSAMGRALSGRARKLLETIGAVEMIAPNAGGLVDLTVPALPPLPEQIRAAASAALARGETHYTSRFGVIELRRALVRQLVEDGLPVTTDGIVVTNGGSEGLYIVLQALLAPGDRVAMPEPVLPKVAAMIGFIGAEVVRVPATAADGFRPKVEALLASGTTTILVASPSPISGVALSPDATRALVVGAAERGIELILDRSLMPAAHDPALAAFEAPEPADRLITIGSFSAGYGLDGWRVGYFTAPADRIQRMHVLKQAMSICTTAVSQFAALAALDGPTGWLAGRRAGTIARRDEAVTTLAAAGLPVIVPDAGQALLVDTTRIDPDDRVVTARLIGEAGVRVRPGSDFGPATAGYIRVMIGAAGDDRLAAIRRIAAMATTITTTLTTTQESPA